MKACTKCKETKDDECFSKKIDGKNGLRSYCKKCEAEIQSKRDRSISNRRYYLLNKDKYKRSWSKDTLTDNQLVAQRLRCRLRNTVRDKIKSAPTLILLGCDLSYFKSYIQSKFSEGMTWDLFIKGDIHIDHIKPCSLFDLSDSIEQSVCFHYTNLQPLWAADNLKKHAKYGVVSDRQ